jgi:hypothetical protein
MDSLMTTTDPRFAIISAMKPTDWSGNLEQFTSEETSALSSLVQQIHDYNLDKAEKPKIPQDILTVVTRWANMKMRAELNGIMKSG